MGYIKVVQMILLSQTARRLDTGLEDVPGFACQAHLFQSQYRTVLHFFSKLAPRQTQFISCDVRPRTTPTGDICLKSILLKKMGFEIILVFG